MKRFFTLFTILAVLLSFSIAYSQNPAETKQPAKPAESKPGEAMQESKPAEGITVQVDKTQLSGGGKITITGKAPAGKDVYIEVWSEKTVRAARLDADPDPKTGKRPYIFYMTDEMPGFYKLIIPEKYKSVLEDAKKEGKKWSVSKVIKDAGADAVYGYPAKIKIDRYQTSLWASIIGSRGTKLEPMDEKENKRRSMQLLKAKFRSVGAIFSSNLKIEEDGSFKATVEIPSNAAPGKYFVVAKVDKDIKSEPIVVENSVTFPNVYLPNAGRTVNVLWPFLLTAAITTFGVLMGAGGGFILNPILVMLGLPHTVVAGTVMPTVLFSQASGIYNYSKIKFINWKLGITLGIAMLVGGFIGPKLTELITLEQYKFLFGWVLIILAALMFWQTTPKYLEKNKKEQAILKEFKRRAEEAAKKKQEGGK
ncbi:sulfite exporter TauE/SafE [Thermodesulfovibrio aggregans]|uniref:Probable membrane transporter protein n=1 Tax=Thermodesulfovibrio aggregans TaxID=86166 RepID=A0A0U9HQS8_9BACT|nr:sulfite exporter TauE/SafE family protein [Thermodesulfovibrio aggregans]GAQ95388.1 sulfite exporter TauE/SafE [Thermodesulfovibrio aggregans]